MIEKFLASFVTGALISLMIYFFYFLVRGKNKLIKKRITKLLKDKKYDEIIERYAYKSNDMPEQLQNDYDLYYIFAICYFEKKNFKKSISELNTCLSINPKFEDALKLKNQCLKNLGIQA